MMSLEQYHYHMIHVARLLERRSNPLLLAEACCLLASVWVHATPELQQNLCIFFERQGLSTTMNQLLHSVN